MATISTVATNGACTLFGQIDKLILAKKKLGYRFLSLTIYFFLIS